MKVIVITRAYKSVKIIVDMSDVVTTNGIKMQLRLDENNQSES